MLGELLEDPEGVEEGGTLRGMGLLPAKTIFTVEKTRTRVSGEIQQFSGMFQRLSGKKLEGYEIHMGVTSINGKAESFSIISEEGKVSKSDGACIENVYGTYVHGIFDEDGIAEELVRILAEKKGIYLEEQQNVDRHAHKESQYDLLADTLRKYLDMDRVYEILL